MAKVEVVSLIMTNDKGESIRVFEETKAEHEAKGFRVLETVVEYRTTDPRIKTHVHEVEEVVENVVEEVKEEKKPAKKKAAKKKAKKGDK